MTTDQSDHYGLLELTRSASMESILAAHRSLGARARASLQGQALAERLRRLDTAVVVLSDPVLRAQYDATLVALQRPEADPDRTRIITPVKVQAVDRPAAAESPAVAAPNPYRPPASGTPAIEERSVRASAAFAAEQWSGFWRRLAAQWVDGLVMYVPSALFMGVFGAVLLPAVGSGGASTAFLLLVLGDIAFIAVYHAFFVGSSRVATLGRMATGIAVVDAQTGAALSFGRAYFRALVSAISAIFLIPNLIMLFDRRRRTLADRLAGTVVVRYKEGQVAVILVVVILAGIALIGILAAIAIPQYQNYVQRAKIALVRVDLAAYSQRLEAEWRRTNAIPALEGLGYTPADRKTRYGVGNGGTIFAAMEGFGNKNAVISLVPSVDKDSGVVSWACVTQGVPTPLIPKDCQRDDPTP